LTVDINAPPDLPRAAEPAWCAYCAMIESKSAHYEFLAALDRKVREGGKVSLAERARQETLLRAHDGCVSAFTTALKHLAVADEHARAEFVRLLAQSASPRTPVSH
jgi:hypothetical protein